MTPKIITTYDPKPHPIRTMDWHAVQDSYDMGDPIGYGPTEADAIRDLEEQLEERWP